ncbi:MAG: hypothetical protein HY842_11655, partial [Bacteroidetes bacterium]|nr:hypothetical protein [Bacteroidota bacterium]
MKKFLSIFTIVALFATVSFSQDATGSGPVMKLDQTEINYGEILQGSDPLRVFT